MTLIVLDALDQRLDADDREAVDAVRSLSGEREYQARVNGGPRVFLAKKRWLCAGCWTEVVPGDEVVGVGHGKYRAHVRCSHSWTVAMLVDPS